MYSQVKSKSIFQEKNSSKINYSTFVYLVNEYASKECPGNPDIKSQKIKELGESIGPRLAEAIHYYKENKVSKRSLCALDEIKLLSNGLWPYLFDKGKSPEVTKEEQEARPVYCIIETEAAFSAYSKDNYFVGNFYAGLLKGFIRYHGLDLHDVAYRKGNKDEAIFTIEFKSG
jgi:hypothetical protein